MWPARRVRALRQHCSQGASGCMAPGGRASGRRSAHPRPLLPCCCRCQAPRAVLRCAHARCCQQRLLLCRAGWGGRQALCAALVVLPHVPPHMAWCSAPSGQWPSNVAYKASRGDAANVGKDKSRKKGFDNCIFPFDLTSVQALGRCRQPQQRSALPGYTSDGKGACIGDSQHCI